MTLSMLTGECLSKCIYELIVSRVVRLAHTLARELQVRDKSTMRVIKLGAWLHDGTISYRNVHL